MMKRKRFYKNRNRNRQWTETPTGRKIDFAEKYIQNEGNSDKFDEKRPPHKDYGKIHETRSKRLQILLTAVLCIICISVGYTVTEVHILRHEHAAEKIVQEKEVPPSSLGQATVQFAACRVQTLALDGGVMLEAVIEEAVKNGFTALAFDAKRADGTLGYNASLALADTYNAVSFPATQAAKSLEQLQQNDLLLVAEICCYQDNVIPRQAKNMAVLQGKSVYEDSAGNTYLNPDNEAVYHYICSLIQELNAEGIDIFVLNGCKLPPEISDNYQDGFSVLSEKLTRDLGGEVKLIEGISVQANTPASWQALTPLSSGAVYSIRTETEAEEAAALLKKKGIAGYIV